MFTVLRSSAEIELGLPLTGPATMMTRGMVSKLAVTGFATVVALLSLAHAPAAQPRQAGQIPRIGVLAPGPTPLGVVR